MGIKNTDLKKIMKTYEANLNTHDIEKATEMIDKNAKFFLPDGEYLGLYAIKSALIKQWELIEDEKFTISNLEFNEVTNDEAVCKYIYTWEGTIDGKVCMGSGNGTEIISKAHDGWKIIHEQRISKI